MKRKPRYVSGTLIVLVLLLVLSLGQADDSFKVGVARTDITPSEATPMWGYSSRHDALSTGVLDPLYAIAMVVQSSGNKIVLVSLDLGRTPGRATLENIRRRIKTQTGIEYSFITATHTHHGPVLELSDAAGRGKGRFDATLRYYSRLEEAIVGCVVQANLSLRMAKMGVRTAQLKDFNFNRQTLFEPTPNDRDLSLMRFDDLAGKPIAIIVNFAVHPTIVPESVLKFSADFVGVMRKAAEEKTGAQVLFIQGAAGDEAPNDQNGQISYQKFGQDLAQEVIKLNSELETKEVPQPRLEVKEARFTFAPRIDLSDPPVRRRLNKLFYPELIANYEDEYAKGIRPRLTVAMFNGDIAWVGVSGEFFSNHSLRLKERARLKHLLFMGYCNGYDQYFPTIEAVAEGGYGTDEASAPVALGAGEEMMNTALIWLYEMRKKSAASP